MAHKMNCAVVAVILVTAVLVFTVSEVETVPLIIHNTHGSNDEAEKPVDGYVMECRNRKCPEGMKCVAHRCRKVYG